MKKVISQWIASCYKISEEEISNLIVVSKSNELKDYSLPCFTIATRVNKTPYQFALEMKEQLEHMKTEEISKVIERVDAVNGYLNFYFVREAYIAKVIKEASSTEFGLCAIGQGQVVCMDYSSPNIAKNFHIGHLRTTVIGNSLYKIYEKLGYQVIRINHLGDWGTQFGKLIVAYHKYSSKELVNENGIDELLRIYVKFNVESKDHPELLDQARDWFAKMEQGEESALSIWKWFKEISMSEFERVYQMLGIEFDSYLGESFYMDQIPDLVKELKEKHLLIESEGAMVVNLKEYQLPPCLIVKSNGSSIYPSRDLAAILYRKKTYGFSKCIYVTGLEQKLHFEQVFHVIERMGYDWSEQLVHVSYGLVQLNGVKLATRQGSIIYAEDLLKEAVQKAMQLIDQKNPVLPDKEKVAQQVGVGAVIFHDLYYQRIKNVNFSWDAVMNFEGESGPYVQYTYVRANSILKKCGSIKHSCEIHPTLLCDEASYTVVKLVANYKEIILEAAKRNEPSVIARYLVSLAAQFNHFYQECRIQDALEEVKNARLLLVSITQRIIKDGMGLLGIECPENM